MLNAAVLRCSIDWKALGGPRLERQPELAEHRLSERSSTRSRRLTEHADSTVRQTFRESFSEALQEELGLVLVATGSYGRSMLVSGRSDGDLTLFATRRTFGSLTPEQHEDLNFALQEFRMVLTERFKGLDLEVNEWIQCGELSDVRKYLVASSGENAKVTDRKIALESITKFLSMRVICGDRDAMDEFEQGRALEWCELLRDSAVHKHAVTLLVNEGAQIIGDHYLEVVVQDVKAQPMTLATINSALISLLVNESNREALTQLEPTLRGKWAFLAGVREALPRHSQVLGPLSNRSIPLSMARIFGDDASESVVPQAYKSAAWIATCYEYLADEAARSGLVPARAKAAIEVTREGALEEVRNIFHRSGDVGLYLHIGLIKGDFERELPELSDLVGVADRYGYQRFTLGRHSVQCASKLDELYRGQGDTRFVTLASELSPLEKAALSFAATLHDCGKPEELQTDGPRERHASIGAKMAANAARRLGFESSQVEIVETLVRWHLFFRHDKDKLRKNMEAGPQSVPEEIRSSKMMKMLTLLSYADLSSRDPDNWNSLAANRLHQLSYGYLCLIENNPNGLMPQSAESYAAFLLAQHSSRLPNENLSALQLHLSQLSRSHLGLPPETVCDFYLLGKLQHLSGRPQVRVVPHALLDSDLQTGIAKYDVLVVGSDKPYLASNLAASLTESRFFIHSAEFFVGRDGSVFNQFTISALQARADAELEKLKADLLKIIDSVQLRIPRGETISLGIGFSAWVGEAERGESESAAIEIVLRAPDQPKLLLRCLIGLNKLGLDLHGADITTTTDDFGRRVAENKFIVTDANNPNVLPNLRFLRAKLLHEFRDPE